MTKRKFLVSHAKPDKDTVGVEVDGKFMPFSKSGRSFYLSDSGVANELEQTLGTKGTKDVIISEVPEVKKDGVHNYFFTVKKPRLEKEKESKFEWVETSPGIKRLVKKEAK